MKRFRIHVRYEEFDGKDVVVDYEFTPLVVLAMTPSSAIRKYAEMVTAKN